VSVNGARGTLSVRPDAHATPWLRPSVGEDPDNARRADAQGREGAVHFFLQRVVGGLYVEREEIPRRGARICQSLQFADRGSFERWCDDDPARFEHPLLHRQLKRDGDALWRMEP
jgi:hypothetical protein